MILDEVRSALAADKLSANKGEIAEWNLICAGGLPGSESLNVDDALTRLDAMADHVDAEIRRNYHRFLAAPSQAENSQAKYCVLMLVTVLQQDFGVRYNSDCIRNPDFRDARDLFVHGVLTGNGGTCASMPVLYTAIGRRLGWPMKLAAARGHLFCRWDDPDGHHPFGKERFNLEGTSHGAHLVDDDYYRRWPEPLSDEMIERGGYLKSLSPEEEVAAFLALRGHCLEDNRRLGKACEVYHWARRLSPNDPHFQAFLEHAEIVRQRLIEEQTLRDYFGPDVPMPVGYFPRHVLRKLASDMRLAETEWYNQRSREAQAHLAAIQRIDSRRMKPHQLGFAHQRPGVPQPWLGMPVPPTPMPFRPDPANATWTGGVPSHPLLSAFPSPAGTMGELDHLPARILQQVHPRRGAVRRQEAIAISRGLPPGMAIQQPRRPFLSPLDTKTRIQLDSNLKEP